MTRCPTAMSIPSVQPPSQYLAGDIVCSYCHGCSRSPLEVAEELRKAIKGKDVAIMLRQIQPLCSREGGL